MDCTAGPRCAGGPEALDGPSSRRARPRGSLLRGGVGAVSALGRITTSPGAETPSQRRRRRRDREPRFRQVALREPIEVQLDRRRVFAPGRALAGARSDHATSEATTRTGHRLSPLQRLKEAGTRRWGRCRHRVAPRPAVGRRRGRHAEGAGMGAAGARRPCRWAGGGTPSPSNSSSEPLPSLSVRSSTMTNSYSSGLVGRGEKSVGSAGTVGSGVDGRGSGTVDGCRLVGGDSHASSSVASRACRSQASCSSLRFASSRFGSSSSEWRQAPPTLGSRPPPRAGLLGAAPLLRG